VADKAATYVFVCSEQTAYTVRATEAKAWVFHQKGTLMLPAVPAKMGTKYSDGAFELWIDGQQAQLGESGSKLQRCRNGRRRAVWEKAKLDGADFRPVGNEPGWNLEILEGSRIVLVADYGVSRVELPLPQPTVDRDARMTRWDAGELIAEVIGRIP
jgi:putative lipoprotein